jgi:hypothetical protein
VDESSARASSKPAKLINSVLSHALFSNFIAVDKEQFLAGSYVP